MSATFYALAVLVCPVGMGAMMWFMMRGGNQRDTMSPAAAPDDAQVTALRAELDQLRAELRDERSSTAASGDEGPGE